MRGPESKAYFKVVKVHALLRPYLYIATGGGLFDRVGWWMAGLCGQERALCIDSICQIDARTKWGDVLFC